MAKEILSIADASALLSLPESEVERLLLAGELPGRRIGPHWFLSRQRLLQFIASDERVADKAEPRPPDGPAVVPERVLSPNWHCNTCGEYYGPEIVECSRCGTVRNTPLMGYRIPRSPIPSGAVARANKIN